MAGDPIAPTWAKFLTGLVVSVILSVVATMSFLDGRYATKQELAIVNKDLETIGEIKRRLNSVDEKLTDLRIMVGQLSTSGGSSGRD